jgi:DNA-binding MarR family transcriptional regulator
LRYTDEKQEAAMTDDRGAIREETLAAAARFFCALEAGAFSVWKDVELTMAQAKAGMFLFHHGPATIGRLADTFHIGQPAASVLVDRLVGLGLVERHEDPLDRRRTLARLTPQGEEILSRFRSSRLELIRDWLEALDTPDMQAFAHALTVLADTAERRSELAGAH